MLSSLLKKWMPSKANPQNPTKSLMTSSKTKMAPEKPKEESIHLQLEHCGEFLIKEDVITGWFHPIPLSTWRKIIGFHKSFSLKYHAETVSYHRWNPKIEDYDTIIPHQKTQAPGLSVNTDWQNPLNIALLDEYAAENGQDFFPACTIHTHVATSAFESGTDAADEEEQAGWHITLGHLTKVHGEIDTHFRFRTPRTKKVKDLITDNESYEIEPENLFERSTTKDEILKCPHDDTSFNDFYPRVTLITHNYGPRVKKNK
jgi:hypothetical protein